MSKQQQGTGTAQPERARGGGRGTLPTTSSVGVARPGDAPGDSPSGHREQPTPARGRRKSHTHA